MALKSDLRIAVSDILLNKIYEVYFNLFVGLTATSQAGRLPLTFGKVMISAMLDVESVEKCK